MSETLIIGGLIALAGSLIIFYLRSIQQNLKAFSDRVDNQDTKIETNRQEVVNLATSIADYKVDQQRETVSKEDWVRSEGYTRKEIKEIGSILKCIQGKLEANSKMPEIIGNVVREVINQNQGG